MQITHGFVGPFTDRSVFDDSDYSSANGWAHVDTRDKGSAVWANPHELAVFTFVEGDTCLCECHSSDEFVSTLTAMAEVAEANGWGPMKIDPRGDAMERAFIGLGLAQYLHQKV